MPPRSGAVRAPARARSPPEPGGEPIADEIGIDDFAKVDLRIARSSTPSGSTAATKLLR
jgi:methionyl-tRNA synthetase